MYFAEFQQQFQVSYYAKEIYHKMFKTDFPATFSFSSKTSEALSGGVLTLSNPLYTIQVCYGHKIHFIVWVSLIVTDRLWAKDFISISKRDRPQHSGLMLSASQEMRNKWDKLQGNSQKTVKESHIKEIQLVNRNTEQISKLATYPENTN